MEPSIKPKKYAKHLQFEGASLTQQILALRKYEQAYAQVLQRADSIWLRVTIPNLIRLRRAELKKNLMT